MADPRASRMELGFVPPFSVTPLCERVTLGCNSTCQSFLRGCDGKVGRIQLSCQQGPSSGRKRMDFPWVRGSAAVGTPVWVWVCGLAQRGFGAVACSCLALSPRIEMAKLSGHIRLSPPGCELQQGLMGRDTCTSRFTF